MKIHQLYTDNALRNFSYVIELNDKTAYVIDPWSQTQINNLLTDKGLKLHAIINTHEHWDHTKANSELVEQHRCQVWAHVVGKGKIPEQSRFLEPNEKIQLDKEILMHVIDTPGHCQAHMCFIMYVNDKAKSIFTGDILFNAGIGNCHDGDMSEMYETITTKMMTLPDDIQILPGHEYLENNLKFTLDREPSNPAVKRWLKKHAQADLHTSPLTTTIADEKDINTFFRLQNNEIRNNLDATVTNDQEVFFSLRKLRNKW
jgi:hydroxyacylglutathione hydrolase